MGLEKRRRRGENQHVCSRFYILVLFPALKILTLFNRQNSLGTKDFKNKGPGVSDLQN